MNKNGAEFEIYTASIQETGKLIFVTREYEISIFRALAR